MAHDNLEGLTDDHKVYYLFMGLQSNLVALRDISSAQISAQLREFLLGISIIDQNLHEMMRQTAIELKGMGVDIENPEIKDSDIIAAMKKVIEHSSPNQIGISDATAQRARSTLLGKVRKLFSFSK